MTADDEATVCNFTILDPAFRRDTHRVRHVLDDLGAKRDALLTEDTLGDLAGARGLLSGL